MIFQIFRIHNIIYIYTYFVGTYLKGVHFHHRTTITSPIPLVGLLATGASRELWSVAVVPISQNEWRHIEGSASCSGVLSEEIRGITWAKHRWSKNPWYFMIKIFLNENQCDNMYLKIWNIYLCLVIVRPSISWSPVISCWYVLT